MNKTAKALLIPVAAFAVTVTGVSAFSSDVLSSAGLTDEQIAAFEEARELREDGDKDGARNVLVEAGIDLATMHQVREAMHKHREEQHTVIGAALATDDYDAFLEAITDSPLADIITTEADFELFKQAYELREAGEFAEAKAIMEELGFPEPPHGHRDREGAHSDTDGNFAHLMHMGKSFRGHQHDGDTGEKTTEDN